MSEFKYSPSDVVKLEDINKDENVLVHDQEDLSALYEKTFNTITSGTLISGKISSIHDRYILVDIGFKSEGIVDREEFDPNFKLKIGQEIEVYMDEVESDDGQILLSYKKALFMHTWDKVVSKFENNETVQGTCVRRIKGGIVVNLMGLDAFLPGSQIDVKPIRDFDALIGKEVDFKIVKVNNARKNVVVSSRAIIEESLSSQREEILKTIEDGDVREGVVKNITDFGVFIDLGGVDGLLHITDLSWGRINHPSEVLALDDKIKVKVLEFDRDKKRISLGLKQLTPHPWEHIEDRFPIGTKISGKVVSIADYGAFIEIDKGVEGLIHISEMSWTQNIKHPSQVLSVGQEVEAAIINIDQSTKKISLGLKQLEPDPWHELENKYDVGTRHNGKVRNLTAFGVFVELEEGVDGLVHISDLSWTKKFKHPGEYVKKGQELEVVVLGLDREERKISLGHKQILENPWDLFEKEYRIGSEITTQITKLTEKGVLVSAPFELEGFIPVNLLGVEKLKKPADKFKENDEIKALITEFDKDSKKLILSVNALIMKSEQGDLSSYQADNKPTTIGDILKAQEEDNKAKE